MRTASKYFAYLIACAIFLVGGLELLLRMVFPDPDYHFAYRFLSVSPDAYQNLDSGIWVHRPYTSIREVGVYAMASLLPPWPRIAIEYDCRMRSNNWGLLQDDDIPPGTSATLILGDSFTAGHGGCPWFPRLQARRPNERIANGGFMGTGFSHWARTIDYLRDRGLVIDRILVIAISDDFGRTVWSWNAEQLSCMNQNICQTNAFWQSVGLDAPQADILERAAARFEVRFPGLTAADFVAMYFKQNSHTYKFMSRAVEALRRLPGAVKTRTVFPPETESALEHMKSLGVPLHVMMVAQRVEAGALGMASVTQDAIHALELSRHFQQLVRSVGARFFAE